MILGLRARLRAARRAIRPAKRRFSPPCSACQAERSPAKLGTCLRSCAHAAELGARLRQAGLAATIRSVKGSPVVRSKD